LTFKRPRYGIFEAVSGAYGALKGCFDAIHTKHHGSGSGTDSSEGTGEDPRGASGLYKRPAQRYGCLCGADKGSGERPRDTEGLERRRDNPEGGVELLIVNPYRDVDRVKFLRVSSPGEYSRCSCGVGISIDVYVHAFINPV